MCDLVSQLLGSVIACDPPYCELVICIMKHLIFQAIPSILFSLVSNNRHLTLRIFRRLNDDVLEGGDTVTAQSQGIAYGILKQAITL